MGKRSRQKKSSGPAVAAEKSAALPGPPIADWIPGLLLFVAVVIAYLPIWRAGFIWDDDLYVLGNPVVVGPLGFKEIWTTQAADICPLTITTFWAEYKLWGLSPLGFHLVNVFLHAGSGVVLWRVLLSLRVPGAILGAALWALHPVLVESVAWIAELKNTQATFFYLLSILFFTRWIGKGSAATSNRDYILTLVFAVMAIASKSSTVILPLVLALCAWWMERRWNPRTLLRIAPILVISGAATLLSMWTQGAHDPQWIRPFPDRFAAAGDAVWFYLGKLIWPWPLVTVYTKWHIDAGQLASFLPLLGVILLLALLWWKRDAWGRHWFFAFAYFLVALLPVLGLVEHYFLRFSFVADHFQNLACMGPLALLGALLARWQISIGAGIVLILAVLTCLQTRYYETEEKIWIHTLAYNPECAVGYGNLGSIQLDRGELDPAGENLRKALAIMPGMVVINFNMGRLLLRQGQVEDAITHFKKAIDVHPLFAEGHYLLGIALDEKGDAQGAFDQFKRTLELKPGYIPAQNNLAFQFAKHGQLDEATAIFTDVVRQTPNDASAHNNLGAALLDQGKLDQAIAEFQLALQLQPGFDKAEKNLARAQAAQPKNPVPH